MPEQDVEKRKEASRKYRELHPDKDRLYYEQNRDRLLAQAQEYYNINKEKVFQYKRTDLARFQSLQNRCKRTNRECLLTFEQYCELISKPCYYCNYQLGKKVNVGSGIDRLDSNLGYIIDNCVSCCGMCNKIKNNFLSSGQAKVAIEAIIKYNKLNGVI